MYFKSCKNFNKTFVYLIILFIISIQLAAGAEEEKKFRIRGKLQTRWELDRASDTGKWADAFTVPHARLDGRWEPLDWLELNLELDFTDGVEAKDMYARIKVDPLFKITTGQFKKPFSRLQLTSPWDLVIPERGLLDEYAVDKTNHGGFGGRDIGLMFSGVYKGPVKLEYYLGAFNNVLDKKEYHRDIVGRVETHLLPGLAMGLNSSFKFYDDSGSFKNAYLLGADLKYKIENFVVQMEGAYGDNVDKADTLLAGAHCITYYNIKLNDSLTLIPAFMFEVFDPAIQVQNDMAFRLAGAMNLDINEIVRVIFSIDGVLQETSDNMLTYPTKTILQLNLKL